MPSKTKKQLNFFKLVKAYKDNGPEGVMSMWGKLFPGRKMPTADNLEKITNVSDKIDYADLEDLASGVDGDEVLGDSKEIKVGYWMKFDSWFSNHKGEKGKATFIAKIKSVRPDIKLVNFNSEDIYNKNGTKIAPVRRSKISSTERMWLDYAYFDQIKETAKDKKDLTMKNEIRKIVREVLSENYINEVETDGEMHFIGSSTLKFRKIKGEDKYFYDIEVNEPRRIVDSSEIADSKKFPEIKNASLDNVVINKDGKKYKVSPTNIRLLHDKSNPPKQLHTQMNGDQVHGQIQAEVYFILN